MFTVGNIIFLNCIRCVRLPSSMRMKKKKITSNYNKLTTLKYQVTARLLAETM